MPSPRVGLPRRIGLADTHGHPPRGSRRAMHRCGARRIQPTVAAAPGPPLPTLRPSPVAPMTPARARRGGRGLGASCARRRLVASTPALGKLLLVPRDPPRVGVRRSADLRLRGVLPPLRAPSSLRAVRRWLFRLRLRLLGQRATAFPSARYQPGGAERERCSASSRRLPCSGRVRSRSFARARGPGSLTACALGAGAGSPTGPAPSTPRLPEGDRRERQGSGRAGTGPRRRRPGILRLHEQGGLH